MATSADARRCTHVPTRDREPILRGDAREISLLVVRENLSLTHASRAAGEHVAGAHVHEHSEAFYVLAGELTFRIGAEQETVTAGTGALVAVPPGVVHSYDTAGDQPACWLVIHAPDGGFAAAMRGLRDNVQVDWDIVPVPTDGGTVLIVC